MEPITIIATSLVFYAAMSRWLHLAYKSRQQAWDQHDAIVRSRRTTGQFADRYAKIYRDEDGLWCIHRIIVGPTTWSEDDIGATIRTWIVDDADGMTDPERRVKELENELRTGE